MTDFVDQGIEVALRNNKIFRWQGHANTSFTVQLRDNDDKLILNLNRNGNLTFSRPTAGSLVLALDAVPGGATDRVTIEFRSAGVKKSEMILDLNAGAIWEVRENAVGGTARLRFINLGASRYWSGPTDTAALKHHEFFSLAGNGTSTLHITLHGDADKISFSAALDASLERIVAGQLLVTSAFVFPEIADPANPAANRGILYMKDNGSGKTQLVALFPSGTSVPIVTEA